MKSTYRHFIRIILFFLALFAFSRLLFLIFNRSLDPAFSWAEAIPAFLHGMRMDLSVIMYCMLIPIVLAGVFFIRPMPWIRRIEHIYWYAILFLFCFITTSSILIFHFWGSLLNFRALSYLKDISEISSSFTGWQFFFAILFLSIYLVGAVYLFKRWAYRPLIEVTIKKTVSLFHWFFMVAASILLMRGGVQMLPMNESLVSFSDDNFINQATINPGWHLANDIYRAGLFTGNPFETMPQEEAEKNVQELFASEVDSFPQILETKNPNIILIILESYTADVVGSLGGEKGISPELDSLIVRGVSFNSIYASGTRTDQGIVSLLNGWPATPYYSIMRSPEKTRNLPSLPILFREKGYRTSFYYGGKSNFSNLNTYCFNQRFETIVDENNFADSIPRGRWGVADGGVFSRLMTDLDTTRQPFFSSVMTLSNHEPFDVPDFSRFKGENDPDRFRNSAAYTDAMLGKFIRNARSKNWYQNTLFIIVADHGHSLPLHKNVYYPDSHRIPLVFFGEPIRQEFRGAVVTKMGGHHDLAGTLLPQLGIKAFEFEWSKNLLNPTVQPFAYYQIDHLLGWIDPKYWYGYSYNRKKFIARSYSVSSQRLDSLKIKGQAFVQVLYDRYRAF